MSFESLVDLPPFSLSSDAKEAQIVPALNRLAQDHYLRSAAYRRIADVCWGGVVTGEGLADSPYLPVSLFKAADLRSTDGDGMVLRSSGTTGQTPSRILVDAETADRQSRALMATFRPILGDARLPLLVIDSRSVISDPATLTARGAGVLGMMKFGGRAAFAVGDDGTFRPDTIRDFAAKFGGQPFLIFGFTFLVWTALYQMFADGELDLGQATLIHSGGWKKLESQKVDNLEFRAALARRFNLTRIYNFYGFVEQIGSIFIEGEPGWLYPPNFTDIVIRDPETWEALPPGKAGIIQVVSLLPKSYPGHNLLTEDLGVVQVSEGGQGRRSGKALKVLGRVPKAELRGCSDVIAAAGAG